MLDEPGVRIERNTNTVGDKRKHFSSGLASESLVDRTVIDRTRADLHALLPQMWLVLVGGSLFDAGKAARSCR